MYWKSAMMMPWLLLQVALTFKTLANVTAHAEHDYGLGWNPPSSSDEGGRSSEWIACMGISVALSRRVCIENSAWMTRTIFTFHSIMGLLPVNSRGRLTCGTKLELTLISRPVPLPLVLVEREQGQRAGDIPMFLYSIWGQWWGATDSYAHNKCGELVRR